MFLAPPSSGRRTPEPETNFQKGPVEAIAIALASGLPLKLAAKIDKVDVDYWEDVVHPLVEQNPSIEYIGEIAEHQKSEFLGNARALLFPIDWPEPFGLCDDRSDGLRNPGHRLSPRLGS